MEPDTINLLPKIVEIKKNEILAVPSHQNLELVQGLGDKNGITCIFHDSINM